MAGLISLCTIFLLCRYDTAQTISDAIMFPIPGKLSKIFLFVHIRQKLIQWTDYFVRILTVGLSPSKNCSVISFVEIPSKLMKNVFISSQKLFSFSRYLSFYHDFDEKWKNSLIRKRTFISKFMTSQSG